MKKEDILIIIRESLDISDQVRLAKEILTNPNNKESDE